MKVRFSVSESRQCDRCTRIKPGKKVKSELDKIMMGNLRYIRK